MANIFSEYDLLEEVILCRPVYMEILEVINRTQEKFIKENIDTNLALKQHDKLQEVLKSHGVNVINLKPSKEFPEQVFARDIGFTLGDIVFIANMKREIRQGEEDFLKEYLKTRQTPFQTLQYGFIEGGDVIIDNNHIWIGLSDRTTDEAIDELKGHLPNFHIKPIPFPAKYLHLDCVFNVISPTEALVYPPAFSKEDLSFLADHYQLIEVSEKEQFTLGTNVFSLGNKKIISLPINTDVNRDLRKNGYTVIEVDITEIIKSGGSFRCITLPITRKKG